VKLIVPLANEANNLSYSGKPTVRTTVRTISQLSESYL